MSDTCLWDEAWWSFVALRSALLWRGVEAQHVVSTMKLVDTADEQAELERILEASKATAPTAAHYLIATPFRYSSPYPSRFRPGNALSGIWYGAETVRTACTELGYWRHRFLMDSAGLRESELLVDLTVFPADVSGRALDMSQPPWDARGAAWTSDDYSACHKVAAAAYRRSVEWIRYWSARDVAGHCGAVFEPNSLSAPELALQQTWHCKVTPNSAFMRHGDDAIMLSFPAKERP